MFARFLSRHPPLCDNLPTLGATCLPRRKCRWNTSHAVLSRLDVGIYRTSRNHCRRRSRHSHPFLLLPLPRFMTETAPFKFLLPCRGGPIASRAHLPMRPCATHRVFDTSSTWHCMNAGCCHFFLSLIRPSKDWSRKCIGDIRSARS